VVLNEQSMSPVSRSQRIKIGLRVRPRALTKMAPATTPLGKETACNGWRHVSRASSLR
jgi:hypothetical protein